MGLFNRKKSEEEEKIKEIFGGLLDSKEFKQRLKDAEIWDCKDATHNIENKIKEEVKNDGLTVDKIDARVDFLINETYEKQTPEEKEKALAEKTKSIAEKKRKEMFGGWSIPKEFEQKLEDEGIKETGTAWIRIKDIIKEEIKENGLSAEEMDNRVEELIQEFYIIHRRIEITLGENSCSRDFRQKLVQASILNIDDAWKYVKKNLYKKFQYGDLTVNDVNSQTSLLIHKFHDKQSPEEKQKAQRILAIERNKKLSKERAKIQEQEMKKLREQEEQEEKEKKEREEKMEQRKKDREQRQKLKQEKREKEVTEQDLKREQRKKERELRRKERNADEKEPSNDDETKSVSNADELLKFAELYEKGLLTKEEFDEKKKELL